MFRFLVHEVEFSVLATQTRFPFRYGIAAMTEAPHLFVRSELEIDGRPASGLTSEGLPPKWFTKNVETTFEDDDLPGMQRVIRQAAAFAKSVGEPLSFFEFWTQLKDEQERWARDASIPPLLAQLGVAILERTVLDGLCRYAEKPLHQVIQERLLGIRFREVHRELNEAAVSDLYRTSPPNSVRARHTVGLADPLTDAEIPESDRIADGLPHSLAANIQAYGLTHFKVKLCGKLDTDRDRLRALARLFAAEAPNDYAITLDGNEQYRDMGAFRDHFQTHQSDRQAAPIFDHLLFVEQPVHRDHALSDAVRRGFAAWPEAPPVIIDESDSGVESLPRALELGYAGTSHKNCKGIVKSLANRALLQQRGGILSAEDLANLGPVALHQDLAMVALLGIGHVERNGHHYFAGLSMFPKTVQEQVLEAHGDVYDGQLGYPALKIVKGSICLDSINRAPFGVGLKLECFTGFEPLSL